MNSSKNREEVMPKVEAAKEETSVGGVVKTDWSGLNRMSHQEDQTEITSTYTQVVAGATYKVTVVNPVKVQDANYILWENGFGGGKHTPISVEVTGTDDNKTTLCDALMHALLRPFAIKRGETLKVLKIYHDEIHQEARGAEPQSYPVTTVIMKAANSTNTTACTLEDVSGHTYQWQDGIFTIPKS